MAIRPLSVIDNRTFASAAYRHFEVMPNRGRGAHSAGPHHSNHPHRGGIAGSVRPSTAAGRCGSHVRDVPGKVVVPSEAARIGSQRQHRPARCGLRRSSFCLRSVSGSTTSSVGHRWSPEDPGGNHPQYSGNNAPCCCDQGCPRRSLGRDAGRLNGWVLVRPTPFTYHLRVLPCSTLGVARSGGCNPRTSCSRARWTECN
jgi:hypothetical protein